MDTGPYSPLKILHHRRALDQLAAGEQPNPTQVQIVLSDLCDHDCHFCAYRMSGYASNQLFGTPDAKGRVNPNRMIPTPKVHEILRDCVTLGVKAIQYTGGGEPTVHKDHVSIFEHTLDLGLELALVTNGGHLHGRLLDILPRGRWVRVSIDAGTADTYASIRRIRATQFDRVCRHVEALRAKRDAAASDMIIGVGFVVTHENYHEIYQAARIAREIGADNIRISAMFSNDDEAYHRPFFDEAHSAAALAGADFDSPTFRVFNLYDDRISDLHEHSPDYELCGYQHFNTYIGADMNVYRCCNTAYNTRGLLGSIADRDFASFWTSAEKRAAMGDFDARGCERCMFNTKNRMIAYAVNPNADHVNYV
jgi:molybdenum cofactor biosynthesis enzyme MoaA